MEAASCEELVNSYVDWLRSRISTKDINGFCEITTPFLDRHNDRLQIYLKREGSDLVLTDDGYIIGDLESSGCAINTVARKRMLHTILAGHGVEVKDGELTVVATPESFPRKKHALLQAMMTVNDMFLTTKHRDASFFIEDIRVFLDEAGVRFSPAVEFTGKSGYSQRFDFLIPKSRTKPERLLKAINSATREAATSLIFAWTDTKDVRPVNSEIYAVVNDEVKSFNRDMLDAFRHYGVKTLPWTRRREFINELAN